MGLFDNLGNMGAPTNSVQPKPVGMGPETFTFSALPENVEQLKALSEASLDSPYKTAALTVLALCAYAADENIGIEMVNFLKGPQPLSTYEKSFIKDRFSGGRWYIPFSYLGGTSPENNYTPTKPITITVSSNPYSFNDPDYANLFIQSSGADSPRNIKLRRKDAQWFLWEQMILVGIREPKANSVW